MPRLASGLDFFYSGLHLLTRERQHEAGTAAGVFLAMDGPVVALGDGAHERQAQADAALPLARAPQAVEGFEDALPLGRRHARAPVADPHHGLPAIALYGHLHRAARVTAGVLQQVADGAPQQL